MNMKMKKAQMIEEILMIAEEGKFQDATRISLQVGCRNVLSGELLQESVEIIKDSDSFPNYYYGTETELKKEKKEDLIKIFNMYEIGLKTLLASNKALRNLLDKNLDLKEARKEPEKRAIGEDGVNNVKFVGNGTDTIFEGTEAEVLGFAKTFDIAASKWGVAQTIYPGQTISPIIDLVGGLTDEQLKMRPGFKIEDLFADGGEPGKHEKVEPKWTKEKIIKLIETNDEGQTAEEVETVET